jgi:hypothetical protein
MNDEQFEKLMELVEDAFNDPNNKPPSFIKDGIFYRLVDNEYVVSEPKTWMEWEIVRLWERSQGN